jgi:PAS domain S-box-containing protein
MKILKIFRVNLVGLLVGTLILVSLYLTSHYSYLLFHILVEAVTMIVAGGIFMVTWNSRRFLENDFLLFIGIAYFFVIFIDLLHTIAYKGMGVFQGYDANLPTQLWIAARYFQSFSLLIAFAFINRKLNLSIVFASFGLILVILLVSIFYWHNFPACFVEGIGLTPFKIISEYVISLMFLTAVALLIHNRSKFDPNLLSNLILSFLFATAAELAFTSYVNVYGLANFVGHICKLISFFYMYEAIIEIGLKQPYDLVFRDLSLSKEMLQKAHSELELRIEERTTELEKANVTLREDITVRKRMEEALRNSEARYRALVEQIPVIAYTDSAEQMGQTLYISPQLKTILGYDPQEWIADNDLWLKIMHEDDRQRILAEYNRTTKTGDKFESEYRLLRRDGRIIWIHDEATLIRDPSGHPLFWQGIMQDRTEHKREEEALILAEEKHRSLTENSPDLIARFDRQLRYLYINSAAAKGGRYSPEDYVGKTLREVGVESQEAQKWEECLITVFATGQIAELEDKFDTPQGIQYFCTKFVPERASDGAIRSVQSIARDITENKQAEEEIRKLNAELEDRVEKRTAQLEAANKELEAFSYSVSHDLRAPLRHINGFAKLLSDQYQKELSEKGQHFLDVITDSAHQMGMLIDDLLQFSRTGRMELSISTVNMNQIVEDVKEQLRRENPERTIQWVIAQLPSVQGDSAMMELVWMNLLDNAIKFTRNRKKAKIEIGSREENGEFVFYVRDNGVGFDMQYAQKLFGVFQRLHPTAEFEGTGIGLANVRRILVRHGGRTWAEAKLEKGATFNFSIPK